MQILYNQEGKVFLMHPIDAVQALATGKYFTTPPKPVGTTQETEPDTKRKK